MPIDAQQRVRKLFSLRAILLMVMLSVLLLPLGSLYFFRFYENVLVQKAEVQLITQSAVFASVYRADGIDAIVGAGVFEGSHGQAT